MTKMGKKKGGLGDGVWGIRLANSGLEEGGCNPNFPCTGSMGCGRIKNFLYAVRCAKYGISII